MPIPSRTAFFAIAPRPRATTHRDHRGALFEEVALPGGQTVTLMDASTFKSAVRSADAKINAILQRDRGRCDAR